MWNLQLDGCLHDFNLSIAFVIMHIDKWPISLYNPSLLQRRESDSLNKCKCMYYTFTFVSVHARMLQDLLINPINCNTVDAQRGIFTIKHSNSESSRSPAELIEWGLTAGRINLRPGLDFPGPCLLWSPEADMLHDWLWLFCFCLMWLVHWNWVALRG